MTERKDRASTAQEVSRGLLVGLAGTAAGFVVAGPPGAILGAVAQPLVNQALVVLQRKMGELRSRRAAFLIAWVAADAHLSSEELLSRLQEDARKEELFLRVMRAAETTASGEKLVALALSLQRGARAESDDDLAWEVTFVRAIDDLDAVHFRFLRVFEQSSNELGLGDGGTEFEGKPSAVNATQWKLIDEHLGLGGMVESRLATLERHGLVRASTTAGGLSATLGEGNLSWTITDFGRSVLERLAQVSSLLAPN